MGSVSLLFGLPNTRPGCSLQAGQDVQLCVRVSVRRSMASGRRAAAAKWLTLEAGMLSLEAIAVGPYQVNCYLVLDPESQRGVLVDPGAQADLILQRVGQAGVTHILLTHGHPDHVGALDEVRQELGVPVGLHPADAEAFAIEADFALHGADEIELGKDVLRIVPIPGHTPGSVALVLVEGGRIRRAIVGDAIFPGGPGHTRSPEALALLLDSLHRTVFSWPDETELFPGHGSNTTVGDERVGFEDLRGGPIPPSLCGDVTWSSWREGFPG